jgi:hypothetical protein
MADLIVCPHCEKEVLIPEKNLKQFPCPECLQAIEPPPEPLTKKWVIFASLSGVLLVLICIIVPVVTGLILDKMDQDCLQLESAFQQEAPARQERVSVTRFRDTACPRMR